MKISINDIARNNNSIAAAIEAAAKDSDSIASGIIGSTFSCSGPGSGWQINYDVHDYAKRALDGEYGASSYIDSEDGREATMDSEGEISWSDESVIELVEPSVEEGMEHPAAFAEMVKHAETHGYDFDDLDAKVATAKEAAEKRPAKIEWAIDRLDACEAKDGNGYLHYAEETSEWYRITEDDLVDLYDMSESENEDTARDYYSHWCNGCGELIGDNAAARQAGLVD